jgi:hypothetical protein
MTIPELVDALARVLSEMALRHREWSARANRHRLDLVARRMGAVLEGALELDAELERMAPCDDLRIELSRNLGMRLGLNATGDGIPTIALLRDALGPEKSKPLVQAALELKAAMAVSTQIAERNRALAETGRRTAEASVKALTKIVIRSRSTQAAYDRAGARSTGVAVPVMHRDWKG